MSNLTSIFLVSKRFFIMAIFFVGINNSFSAPNSDFDALDKTLAKLISFQTVSDNKKLNQEALDWVKKELQGLPL
ncbi:MAG: hypothetical protein PSV35_07395, partial [bacterium]|nr:hypothetical protein [bacterium]